jgi:hypothetical protein
MSSPTYAVFVRSMIEGRPVYCVVDGRPRLFSEIILGHKADGTEGALVWQTSGRSSQPLPGWRNITLSAVTGARLEKGKLQVGTRSKGQQRWVTDVDLDVNPASPYQPRRRLDDLR